MRAVLLTTLLALAGTAGANELTSPVGVWKTIDDRTRQARSLVQITEVNGVLEGKVIKLFRKADEDPNPKCDKCEPPRKDQPVLGMTILWGLKKDGNQYGGGHILDPKQGSVYKSQLRVMPSGKQLEVRGYLGIALIGRTQTWVRE